MMRRIKSLQKSNAMEKRKEMHSILLLIIATLEKK
jgi:hypothetical protein